MKSLIEYFSRIGKSKGFGIQSPWAFCFVKDVIMEKLPYYAYDEIDKKYNSRNERKKQRLYFRIRNYVNNRNFCLLNISNVTIDEIRNVAIRFGNTGVIILEDIYCNTSNIAKWVKIKDSDFIGITFDLYFCSICFMPNQMYKQHYKLNF